MLVQALYNIVDSVFVGMISEQALTAVSLCFPAQNLMIAVATGTGVGINALLSRSLGEKNFEKANKVAGQGFFLNFCGYLVFLLLGIFFVPFYVDIQAEGSLLSEYAKEYSTIVCIASVGVFIQIVTGTVLFRPAALVDGQQVDDGLPEIPAGTGKNRQHQKDDQ
jgi:Na+-driven multidrug efflux pump